VIPKPRASRLVIVPVTVATALGVLLLLIGFWLRPIAAAEQAMAAGDADRALQQYTTGRRRLQWIPGLGILFPGLNELVTGNELSLQYALRRYDRIIEATGSGTGSASTSFWAGCALFDKALVEVEPEKRVEMMSRAHDAFRRTLELAPDDWDAKFNYELSGRLSNILREQPRLSAQEMIRILRDRGPKDSTGRRTG
jgi:hypothetical protein